MEDEDDEELDDLPRYQYKNQSQQNYQYVNSEKDFILPLKKHKNIQPIIYESPDDEISMRKYLGSSVSLVSLITENLLSHPFLVLRRQCQVHHIGRRYHLTPITLFAPIIRLHKRQGFTTLWKGLGSCLLVRGMSLAIEDFVTKITPWPKEVNSHTTLKQFGQHILLKCISLAVVMPFYSASLVETVQSDIASDKPGIFDVFREGGRRLFSLNAPQKGRMIPVWQLVGPSVGLGITKYMFGLIVRGITTRILQRRINLSENQKGAKSKDISTQNQNIEIFSTLISIMTTEIIFYPFETILHRLQLQGTRTIIDDLDSGFTVVPILTSYEGAMDCYKTTIASEGFSGLYKGFGAMILQFVAHVAVIKLTKWIVTQISEASNNKPPPQVSDFYTNLQGHNSVGSTTVSRSLSSISVSDL